MPRHIDAEKIDFRLPYFEDENGDALVSLRAVKQCIDATPSEDVVPREELDAMRGAANSYKMHYETAKAEVVGKIFDEMERLMENNEVWFRQTDEMREEFAELKKKYTEGE